MVEMKTSPRQTFMAGVNSQTYAIIAALLIGLIVADVDFAHPNQSPFAIFSSADKWPFNGTYNLQLTGVRPKHCNLSDYQI